MIACRLPQNALLRKYRDSASASLAGSYTDCYSVSVAQPVALADFVCAFYTTPVFKLERLILKYLVARPSTDEQAKQLANGSIDTFAAWSVEERTDDQLLMCDFHSRTRSWFMVVPLDEAETLLLFGSAVTPAQNRKTGQWELGTGFSALLGFHKLYSRVLLSSATRRLSKLRT